MGYIRVNGAKRNTKTISVTDSGGRLVTRLVLDSQHLDGLYGISVPACGFPKWYAVFSPGQFAICGSCQKEADHGIVYYLQEDAGQFVCSSKCLEMKGIAS